MGHDDKPLETFNALVEAGAPLAVKFTDRFGLPIDVAWRDWAFAGLRPQRMGLEPSYKDQQAIEVVTLLLIATHPSPASCSPEISKLIDLSWQYGSDNSVWFLIDFASLSQSCMLEMLEKGWRWARLSPNAAESSRLLSQLLVQMLQAGFRFPSLSGALNLMVDLAIFRFLTKNPQLLEVFLESCVKLEVTRVIDYFDELDPLNVSLQRFLPPKLQALARRAILSQLPLGLIDRPSCIDALKLPRILENYLKFQI